MIKKLLLLIFMLACLAGFSQRYKTDSTYIRFFSDAPMEDIEAVNTAASSVIDVSKNAIVVVVPIKGFQFPNKLMQEHFNENYLESDKYPRAVFKGKIENWNGRIATQKLTARGTLEIHGVVQEVMLEGEMLAMDNGFSLVADFFIKLADYNIKIPKAVFYKIAEEVLVSTKFYYKPYEKN